MEERIDLVVEERRRTDGVSIAIGVSLVFHAVLIFYIVRTYRPVGSEHVSTPILRYVELMRQNPDFVEAPGAKRKAAPIDAPFSDANRKASTPHPTGDTPTKRPGDGTSRAFTPPTGASRGTPHGAPASAGPAAASANTTPAEAGAPSSTAAALAFRQPSQASSSGVNWNNAIREVSKVASLGGKQSLDLGQPGGGGEKGFAENGEPSFESQWFDWGEYAAGMVRRIRVNWISIMPDLIKTGMKGHLIIRITIHRDGRISDIEILQSSGIPPYDFAAKKALEMSSPIAPLPKDFPNDTERVTFGFFYNEEPPVK